MKNTHLETIIRAGIYGVFLLPFFFSARTMYPWHVGRTLLFYILVQILVFVTVLYLRKTKTNVFRITAVDWAVFAFFLTQFVSVFFGVNPLRSFWGYQIRMQGVITLLHLILFYGILRQHLNTKKQWERLFMWIIGVAGVSSLIAWIGAYVPTFLAGKIHPGTHLSGLLGNPIFFAAFLVMSLIFSLYLFFTYQTEKKQYRWFFLGLFFFLLATLIGSQVRGAFLGLLAGAFAGLLTYGFFAKQRKERMTIIAILAIGVVGFFGLYFLNQRTPVVKNTVPQLARVLNVSLAENTAQTRLMAWKIAFDGWKERPLFGWGPENYQAIFDAHYNPIFLQFSFAETVWDKPHNYALDILSTSGIVGFVAYFVLLFFIAYAIIRKLRGADTSNDVRAGSILFAGFIMFVVQSWVGIESIDALILWFTFIAVVAVALQSTSDRPVREKPYGMGWLVIAGIFLLLGAQQTHRLYASSILMGDARDTAELALVDDWQQKAQKTLAYPVPFLWEQAMYTVQDIAKIDGVEKLRAQDLEELAPTLLSIYEKELEKHGDTYQPHFWIAEVYAFMGEYLNESYLASSTYHLEQARKISPNQQRIPMLIAKNYLIQGEAEKGIQELRSLVEINPDLPEPHWFLGLALLESGNRQEGIVELEKGTSFGLGIQNNVLFLIDVYAEEKTYEKIVPLYEQLIVQDPNNDDWYARLAATHVALGNREEALLAIHKAVQINPALRAEAEQFIQASNL